MSKNFFQVLKSSNVVGKAKSKVIISPLNSECLAFCLLTFRDSVKKSNVKSDFFPPPCHQSAFFPRSLYDSVFIIGIQNFQHICGIAMSLKKISAWHLMSPFLKSFNFIQFRGIFLYFYYLYQFHSFLLEFPLYRN